MNDLETINRYLARVRGDAEALGLDLSFSSDPAAFAEFLEQQDETHGVSSVHDPRRSDIRPREFAWMLVKSGDTGVCCHAIRLFETDDLIADIYTGRIYEDIPVRDHWPDPEMYEAAEKLLISGRVAFGGGLWVHPAWRGQNLSAVFRKALRVVTIPRFKWEHYVSTYRNTANRREWAKGDGWTPNVIPLSKGYYVPYGKELDVILTHATVDETLDVLRREMAPTATPAAAT